MFITILGPRKGVELQFAERSGTHILRPGEVKKMHEYLGAIISRWDENASQLGVEADPCDDCRFEEAFPGCGAPGACDFDAKNRLT